MVYKDLTSTIIREIIGVHNELGPGLLESPYHKALCIALERSGLSVEYEKSLPVYFKGIQVGDYYADLVVNNCVLIEVKSVQLLTEVHLSQMINYLNISKIKVGMLVNFSGQKAEWKRVIL